MEFGEALRRRRMVRRYTDDPVEPTVVERIAAAALSGPSAGWSQGIAVVVIQDSDRIATIARLCGEEDYVAQGFDPWLSTASAHLVLCVEPEVYRERYRSPDKDLAALEPIPWWWVDGGAALMAALLAAVDEGIAAGFHGGQRSEGIASLLGIPDEVLVLGVVTLGHPAPDRRSSSLDRGTRPGTVHPERW